LSSVRNVEAYSTKISSGLKEIPSTLADPQVCKTLVQEQIEESQVKKNASNNRLNINKRVSKE